MCYDISFTTTAEVVSKYLPDLKFENQLVVNFDPFHIKGHDFNSYPVVVWENNNYVMKNMEWGVIAPYMNTPEKIKKMRPSMLNAQSEKLFEPTSFWRRIKNNRCLIPVTAIYEHRKVDGFKNKIPYHIKVKGSEVTFIPGLYSYSPIPDPETGELKPTFALLTRKANKIMEQIHNDGDNRFRMLLFLPHELELKWLVPDLTDDEIKEIINYELPSTELEYYTVASVRARKPREDGKPKNAEFIYDGLPELNTNF